MPSRCGLKNGRDCGGRRLHKRRDALGRFADLIEPGYAKSRDRRGSRKRSRNALRGSPARRVAVLLALVVERPVGMPQMKLVRNAAERLCVPEEQEPARSKRMRNPRDCRTHLLWSKIHQDVAA